MNATNEGTAGLSARQIVNTRIVNASRELVWKAWTDPKHIIHWWGPTGFTNTIHEMDVRPGGTWRFIMHGPDGTNYENENLYLEVVKPERLIYEHVSPPKHSVKTTFEECEGKTKITMEMTFATAEERDTTVEKYGAVEGMKQTLGRMAEYVANWTE